MPCLASCTPLVRHFRKPQRHLDSAAGANRNQWIFSCDYSYNVSYYLSFFKLVKQKVSVTTPISL